MNFDVAGTFNREFDAAIAEEAEKSGFAVDDWIQLGSAATNPKNMIKGWRTRGPECVQNFIDWYEASGYQVWITPAGQPAIELELRPMFGDIEVLMYIDLILYDHRGLLVMDLKSGSKQPDNPQQLGLYASGVELVYGVRPWWSAFYMNRKATVMGPYSTLGHGMSVEFFTQQFAAAERGIDAKAFTASPGDHCAICGVKDACAAIGGEKAAVYDPAHPDFIRS